MLFRSDLIFLDIMLPGMEGYKVAKAIRKKPELASTPIVVVSARAGIKGKDRAIKAGCQEFLHKPYKVNEIKEILGRYLG